MKKVRSIINIILGSIIAALGITSAGCECKYGVMIPEYGCPIDTTVHCMYGVDPVVIDFPDEEDE